MTEDKAPKELTKFLLYKSPDGNMEIEVFIRDETVWLTQTRMSELFGKSQSTISEHVNNIYNEGELEKELTLAKFGNSENSQVKPNHYNNNKLNNYMQKKDIDWEMLWGDGGPYSESKITINTRILDNEVSRTMIEVTANINPTTFKIIKKHKDNFKDDEMVTNIIKGGVYWGKNHGYVVSLGEEDYREKDAFQKAILKEELLRDAIIRMHDFIGDYLGLKGTITMKKLI
jgi:hypothetical protein